MGVLSLVSISYFKESLPYLTFSFQEWMIMAGQDKAVRLNGPWGTTWGQQLTGGDLKIL